MKSKFNFEKGPSNIRTSFIPAERTYGKKTADEMLKAYSGPQFYGLTNNKICSKPEDQEPKKITQ